MNRVWDSHNRGVRAIERSPSWRTSANSGNQRQWKDIRSKYAEKAEEDDE